MLGRSARGAEGHGVLCQIRTKNGKIHVQTSKRKTFLPVSHHFTYADQLRFSFVDKELVPLVCAVQERCPSDADKQITEAVMAVLISSQQFLNRGVDTQFTLVIIERQNNPFRCKSANLTINPKLYQFGTKFNPNMKYLDSPIDCSAFQPKIQSTTAAPTTTTAFSWSEELAEDDSFANDFSSSSGHESEEIVETTEAPVQTLPTKRPSNEGVRVHLKKNLRSGRRL